MNVETMRIEIAKAYPGLGWKRKVKEMSENQVIAVYHTFQKGNKFKPARKTQVGPVYKQLTFDDISKTK
ncbi:MAG: hypothetical protein RBT15_04745 [Gudongella sp.]|nr:hypothetical protein [Gudongella sp.]